jgi:dTDP-4-amino-4,6-dideoxygalactose transaminase
MPVEGEAGACGCRIFYLLLPSPAARGGLIEHLADQGIGSAFHYLPLHRSRMGRIHARQSSPGEAVDDCPVAVWASERLVRLPLYFNLEDADQEKVIEAVLDFESGGPA